MEYMRKCRCCDAKIKNSNFDLIRCGFCGESVNQSGCETPYGKWFHTACFRDFKNFYSCIFTIDAVKDRNDLIQFRDYVLFQMIMRKDLRPIKQAWSLLVKNKAVPLVIAPDRIELTVV